MNDFGLFSHACILRDYKSKRSSSWERNGGNSDWVVIPGNGGKCNLLDEKEAGCIKHFYWTFICPDHGGAPMELTGFT